MSDSSACRCGERGGVLTCSRLVPDSASTSNLMGERNIWEFGEETMRGRTTHSDSFEGHLETGEQESNNRNPSNRYIDALLTLDKSSVQLETKKSSLSLQSKLGSASLDNKGVTRFVIIDNRVFFRECV